MIVDFRAMNGDRSTEGVPTGRRTAIEICEVSGLEVAWQVTTVNKGTAYVSPGRIHDRTVGRGFQGEEKGEAGGRYSLAFNPTTL